MAEQKINPEIVAIITAAVQSMTGGKVVAVKIKNNPNWTMSNRIKQ